MINFTHPRIDWYRTPVDKTEFKALTKKSDLLGLLQAGGHLALIAGAMAFAVWLQLNAIWWALPFAAILYGFFANFSHAASHELSHNTVFKTKGLNQFFALIFDILRLANTPAFWASHREHHRYTLHFPDDMEAIQPQDFKWKDLLRTSIVNLNPNRTFSNLRNVWKTSTGQDRTEWALHLIPEEKTKDWAEVQRTARLTLVVHALVWIVCLSAGLWIVPVLFTGFGQFGSIGMGLCGVTQHIGLKEKGDDFRTCCRTVIMNPFIQYLYWHMNYHIEHHMYPAVPCYRLGKLHRLIQHDLPPTPQGFIEAYREINAILAKQAEDPSYRYVPPVPNPTQPRDAAPATA